MTLQKYNIKLTISYFGPSYAGWQSTKMGTSVEETLEKALSKILQHEVQLQAASRTDAGVHAEAQVVNFFAQRPLPLNRFMHSLNCMLPKDIAIVSAEEMPEDFHPTLDNLRKEYWYHICNAPTQLPFDRETSWHFYYPLDMEKMRKAASGLLGTHDFSAFCNKKNLLDCNPSCHLEKVDIVPLPGQRLRIELKGNRFLFRMARNIVGTLAYIGCGKLPEGALPTILESRDRILCGITAPAHGLVLKQVFYSEKMTD